MSLDLLAPPFWNYKPNHDAASVKVDNWERKVSQRRRRRRLWSDEPVHVQPSGHQDGPVAAGWRRFRGNRADQRTGPSYQSAFRLSAVPCRLVEAQIHADSSSFSSFSTWLNPHPLFLPIAFHQRHRLVSLSRCPPPSVSPVPVCSKPKIVHVSRETLV